MGDSTKQFNSAEMAGDINYAMSQYFPGLAQQIYGLAPMAGATEVQNQNKFQPVREKINTRVYKQYAPEYAKTAELLQQIASEGELGRMKGVGGDTVRSADALNREIDPEFYKTRELIAQKLAELINNPVTAGETEAMTRGINRVNVASGNSGVPSNLNTVSNAMTFGSGARDRLGQALNMAIGANPGMKTTSTENVFSMGTARDRALNTQAQTYAPFDSGLDRLFGVNQTMMQGQYGLAGEHARARAGLPSTLEKAGQGTAVIGNIVGAVRGNK